MKTLFTLYFLAITFSSLSQDSVITYTEVIQIPAATKEQLFIRARQWFNETFKSAKDVLQINDKQTGELAGKGYIKSFCSYRLNGTENSDPITVHADIAIYVKQGKYKYEFTNFYVLKYDNSGPDDLGVLRSDNNTTYKHILFVNGKPCETFIKVHEPLNIIMTDLVESLKNYMSSKKSKLDF